MFAYYICVCVYVGVGDEGVSAVCRGCRGLSRLDVSYLGALTDAGVRAAAGLPRLARLTARGNPALSSASLAACLAACPMLQVYIVIIRLLYYFTATS